ncbi:hypothetical protein Bca4012_038700 [Brassica carinata]|uniref:Uncharacterized protein n=1 Tax=Brassica carinata TaxID=52824 RepID=A0A8X7W858_BRACI|nr:hypothetical protein Bca52824_006928 [Brassica carinata]
MNSVLSSIFQSVLCLVVMCYGMNEMKSTMRTPDEPKHNGLEEEDVFFARGGSVSEDEKILELESEEDDTKPKNRSRWIHNKKAKTLAS